MEPVRLRNVAKKVSLSESRFSHLFRLECGLDFSSCLLELRIRAARQLLAGTDLAVGEIAARCGFSKATLARLANMSEVYVYQVFAGRRHPTRDRLLALCVGLGATLDETQVILRQAAWGELYPRIERDAIIAHGIVHGASLNEINNSLGARGEEPLC